MNKGSIENVCDQFDKSRQAYYQSEKRRLHRAIDEEIVLAHVRGIRSRESRIGTRKLHDRLRSVYDENGIKMGRDKLFTVLKGNGLLV